jgi:hypothetical protein
MPPSWAPSQMHMLTDGWMHCHQAAPRRGSTHARPHRSRTGGGSSTRTKPCRAAATMASPEHVAVKSA